jgi:hypothetical protein
MTEVGYIYMTVEVCLFDCSLGVEIVFYMSWNSFFCIWLGIVCNGIGGVADESKEGTKKGSIGNYQWLWWRAQVPLCNNLGHMVQN